VFGGRKIVCGLAALFFAAAAARAQNVSGRLDFSDNIRMVDCDPAATVPCFRLKFNIVDAQGGPLPAQIPPPEKLAENITVQVGDQAPITPFYAVASAGDKQTVRGRVALVLIDISGSMNRPIATGQTRFEAAKAALSSFLDGFQDGIDRVAIVPFESHQVEPTIRAARFASTRQEALQQIQALPLPQAHNNTGLYSAVALGLDLLSQELAKKGKAATSPEALIVLMTDGKNEVFKGDDAGLLDGPSGLQTAAAKVQSSGVQVIGVGFGDPKDIDEVALRQLSSKYYMTADLANLTKVFAVARTLLASRIQATFSSPWPDRASLAGKTLHVSVKLKLASGQELGSDQKIWATPQMGVPLFESHCDTDEMKALYQRITPTESGWISVLRPVLVFVGLGVLLLILWFWIPRLVWADQYIGAVPTKRWAGQSAKGRSAPGNAPPGFDAAQAGQQAPRASLDQTIVMPRPDFTKTRLGPLPPPDRGAPRK
jgi:Mg-chelatase subunit ChlD